MFAVARFSVSLGQARAFESNLAISLSALSQCHGYIKGEYGQNLDDSTLWSLVTHWENVGSYRRALSNNTVKMQAIATLAHAIDEPGAYEGSFSE